MKRLLTSTTALSLALMNVQAWPAMAQVLTEDGRVVAADGTVLCEPTADVVCDPADPALIEAANVIAAQMAVQAEADAAAQAEIDAAAKAEADAQAELDAAAKAEADAAAQAETDAAAKAEADAAAQAEIDAAAKADADADAQAELDAAAKAEADAAALAPIEPALAPTPEEIAAAQDAALAQAALEVTAVDGTPIDPAAGLKVAETVIDPNAVPVDAPVVSEAEVESLSTLIAPPVDQAAPVVVDAPLEPALAKGAPPAPLADLPPAADAVAVATEVVTGATQRSATQEFAAPPTAVAPGKKTGLSDLEKVGLFVLGAVVIGSILNKSKEDGGQQVVSNTGDRVVVLNPNGSYSLYKDDDAVLRQPGSTVRTETFKDGSSRTIVQRKDGTQVVTVRNATGRVLRRAQYDRLGRELVLLDDMGGEAAYDPADYPAPKKRVVISTMDNDAALKAALAAQGIAKLGRTFSLRQIREIAQVRALAAEVDVDRITFDSGSAAIKAAEAGDLADLGKLMQDMLAENPAEMFLVEGHTDATGAAAMNLALSDRRAESVALALTEYFDIPPENMIVQGYGETELRVDTQLNEARNRRVAVRIITPLLRKF